MAKRIGAKPWDVSRKGRGYVPDGGDLTWFSFSPHAGREQAGRRPALVLSPPAYNAKAGLCVVCPISTQVKKYPFEVPLPAGLAVVGVVLSDHVKSVDWQARAAEFAGAATDEVVAEVRARLKPLLGI